MYRCKILIKKYRCFLYRKILLEMYREAGMHFFPNSSYRCALCLLKRWDDDNRCLHGNLLNCPSFWQDKPWCFFSINSLFLTLSLRVCHFTLRQNNIPPVPHSAPDRFDYRFIAIWCPCWCPPRPGTGAGADAEETPPHTPKTPP